MLVRNAFFGSLLLLSSVIASPLRAQSELEPRAKPQLISIEEMRKQLKPGHPHKDKAIFFTHHLSEWEWRQIEAWAEDRGLDHAGSVWRDKDMVDLNKYEKAPWERELQFWSDFSRVYAQEVSGTVYLIMRHAFNPRVDSIFYDVELAEIKRLNKVDKIVWIDPSKMPDLDDVNPQNPLIYEERVYWRRGDPMPPPEYGYCLKQYRCPNHFYWNVL